MKRSEVIEAIHNYTTTLNIPNGDMTIDEHILNLVESLGMLPPARGLTYDDLAAARHVMHSEQLFRYYHMWDKE